MSARCPINTADWPDLCRTSENLGERERDEARKSCMKAVEAEVGQEVKVFAGGQFRQSYL